MSYYTKQEIADMIEQRNNMILVPETFNHMIRLELKWAYVGFLNVMLDEPQFNESMESYFNENREKMAEILGRERDFQNRCVGLFKAKILCP